MEYIASLVLFLSAIAGICGVTWNDQKRGRLKFTTLGWATLACSFASLLVSLWLIYEQNSVRGTIRTIGNSEIGITSTDFLANLNAIRMSEISVSSSFEPKSKRHYDLRQLDDFNKFIEEKTAIVDLANLPLIQAWYRDPNSNESALTRLKRISNNFRRELDVEQTRYASFLPPEELLLCSQISRDRLFKKLDKFEEGKSQATIKDFSGSEANFENFIQEFQDLLKRTGWHAEIP